MVSYEFFLSASSVRGEEFAPLDGMGSFHGAMDNRGCSWTFQYTNCEMLVLRRSEFENHRKTIDQILRHFLHFKSNLYGNFMERICLKAP